jgi:hypothetical protein
MAQRGWAGSRKEAVLRTYGTAEIREEKHEVPPTYGSLDRPARTEWEEHVLRAATRMPRSVGFAYDAARFRCILAVPQRCEVLENIV